MNVIYVIRRTAHPDETPLDRHSFFQREQERKWNGIKRCC
ncbi:MAG: CstA-like transporter-associated (seleno)protein [Rheinheimera sp.]|nr:CstA-like transporter-associated (seleno)protein [Rheinheimera sp.]